MADHFYSAVQAIVAKTGLPVLSLRACYVYVLLDEPVEMEGTGLQFLLSRHVPGVEVIQRRIESRTYGLIIDEPRRDPLQAQVEGAYGRVAVCPMKYFYGPVLFQLWVPREAAASIDLSQAGCREERRTWARGEAVP
jgi:hypothetical protein